MLPIYILKHPCDVIADIEIDVPETLLQVHLL